MPASTILGFFGDSLTFAGALILAIDAIRREIEFRRQKSLSAMISQVKTARFTMDGIELVGEDATQLVFIRQSIRRAIWGTSILSIGFIFLLLARIFGKAG